MCQYPLFETLAIIDGKVQNLPYHQQRVDYAIKHYFKRTQAVRLDQIFTNFTLPRAFQKELVRCRIDYNATDFKINVYPYTPHKIDTFQCVYSQNLEYQFKYTNREQLTSLKNTHCDEIIIINNGFVSDCSIGNLIFFKENQWYSSKHFLLKGTQLSYLLEQKKVKLIDIPYQKIVEFEKIMMINALNPFEENKGITISKNSIKV
ncbi:aminotransferase class IV family protein [Pasteurella skyensis]|uniref:Aminotransferase class IV family protein n=1 Tax=Phocoenobacter skyensis TaxID=97481 RepID=A0AAJ6NDC7_9PAST|nr:aminotransferase class IV family protein [Pasteurella skyensis]MDP8170723.1 aminotransferase class IV family protein [Pasteurella skyensis]MDP8174744.1 aminotransferase class IV family protein [Pasteurella skyensis]